MNSLGTSHSYEIYGSCLSYRRHLQIRRSTNKSFGIRETLYLNRVFGKFLRRIKTWIKKMEYEKKSWSDVTARTPTLTCDGQPLIRERVFSLTATYIMYFAKVYMHQQSEEKWKKSSTLHQKEVMCLFFILTFKTGQNLLFIYVLFFLDKHTIYSIRTNIYHIFKSTFMPSMAGELEMSAKKKIRAWGTTEYELQGNNFSCKCYVFVWCVIFRALCLVCPCWIPDILKWIFFFLSCQK